MAFGGMGNAGGLEAIASGAAREQFRRNLLTSASSAWKEGAKAFGVNLIGEMTEEQFIGALDLAFVRMEIHPGMNSADLVRQLQDTAVVTALSSGGFSAAHGRSVMKEVVDVQGSMGSNDTPGMDGTTVENATAVADAAESTADTAIPTTEDVATAAADTTVANGGISAPMLPDTVFEVLSDPSATLPDGTDTHRVIHRPQAPWSGPPPRLSPQEMDRYGEEFARNYRAADGFVIKGEFIPAEDESAARTEYARSNGLRPEEVHGKARRATAWIDAEGDAVGHFPGTKEREAWREERIRNDIRIDSQNGRLSPPPELVPYEEAVERHPFLRVMATISHDRATYDENTGAFSMISSQGGRIYELTGNTKGKSIHVDGLFPEGDGTSTVGPTSFGAGCHE